MFQKLIRWPEIEMKFAVLYTILTSVDINLESVLVMVHRYFQSEVSDLSMCYLTYSFQLLLIPTNRI